MRSLILLGCAAIAVIAHPGMDRIVAEIEARHDYVLAARSTSLLGDLREETTTATGQLIADILTDVTNAIAPDAQSYQPPGSLGSASCRSDTLCVWYYVGKEMWAAFADQSGCTDLARGAIRQGFHDAAAWDVDSPYGGADGSLLLSDELTRPENRGLQAIGAVTKALYDKYHPYGTGMADLIQFGAIVGTVACPGGPRIRTFIGRKDDNRAAPPGKLPSPFMNAPTLISLFAKKTFTPSDLVALVGAHTSARQRLVDPSRAGAALDTDPQIWDASYYRGPLGNDNQTIFILPSDQALARDPSTNGIWSALASANGQAIFNPAYAQAYFRMSILGVNNLNRLQEITSVVPGRR
ncbi:peroxidase [Xylariaceae sp. FL0594]|nr:peroxidase [Xylariaceae sp. FL0594]